MGVAGGVTIDAAVALGAALVAYNTLINRWRPFHGAAYVPVNLSVAAIVVAVAMGPLALSARDLGLTSGSAVLGLALGLACGMPLVAAAFHPRGAARLADRRLEGMRGWTALFYVAVRIPLGTAVLEEVAFRGVLYAAAGGGARGAILSSVAFGLWHVAPTVDLIRANRPDAARPILVTGVAAGVLATFAAGLLFAWMRGQTGGIASPFALHASVNSLAACAALIAHRRRAR